MNRPYTLPAVVLVLALTSAPSLARAQPATPSGSARDAITALEQSLLTLRVGFGGTQLVRAGQVVPFGFFGGELQTVFAGSPKALAAARSFRTYRMIGLPLYIVGTAALLADLFLIGFKHSSVYDNRSGEVTGLWYGLLIGGAVLGVGGGAVLGASQGRLSEAVERYNEDVFARVKSGVRAGLLPVPGGVAAGLSGRF